MGQLGQRVGLVLGLLLALGLQWIGRPEGLTVEALANTGVVTPSMSESLQRAAERAMNRRLQRLGDAPGVPTTQPLGA